MFCCQDMDILGVLIDFMVRLGFRVRGGFKLKVLEKALSLLVVQKLQHVCPLLYTHKALGLQDELHHMFIFK